MILFKHSHIFPILIGLKTQTRRTWEKARIKPGSIHLAKTEMISKQFFARLRVLEVYQERLCDMTEQDAWEEGGYTLDSYRETFQRIYGFWDDNRIVWTVKFEIIDKREQINT